MKQHQPTFRPFTKFAALVLTLACTAAAADEARIWRAAVFDAQAKAIRVWDLGEQEEVASFKTRGSVQFQVGLEPMSVVTVEAAPGEVRLLHLGLTQEDHGDHKHWVTGKPTLGPVVLQGLRPSHVNAGAGQLAVFFDGDGAVRTLTPHATASPVVERLADRAHHGIAVPLAGGRLLISIPASEGTLPRGMQLLDSAGKPQTRSPHCGAQHGDGHHQLRFLFGCDNGLLLYDDQRQTFELLPYPADAGKRMVRNMVGTPIAPRFVAGFGPSALLLIDLDPQKMIPVPLPAPVLHYGWDATKPDQVYALLHSGELLALNARSGQILNRTALLPPWQPAAAGETSPPVPKLAASAGRIAVVDPRSGLLHFVRSSDLKALDRIVLGGQPISIVMRSVNLDPH